MVNACACTELVAQLFPDRHCTFQTCQDAGRKSFPSFLRILENCIISFFPLNFRKSYHFLLSLGNFIISLFYSCYTFFFLLSFVILEFSVDCDRSRLPVTCRACDPERRSTLCRSYFPSCVDAKHFGNNYSCIQRQRACSSLSGSSFFVFLCKAREESQNVFMVFVATEVPATTVHFSLCHRTIPNWMSSADGI
jgi:hypothetical protein